jgi:hypothetical protein
MSSGSQPRPITPEGKELLLQAVYLGVLILGGLACLVVPWFLELSRFWHWWMIALGFVLIALAIYQQRKWQWRERLRIWWRGTVRDPNERIDEMGPNQFMRLLARRGRVKRYLRNTFDGRIDIKTVFRAAALELWHNQDDIDNYLYARDPKEKGVIDPDEWFIRIAHNFARDYIERSGRFDDTAQGVFVDFVRQKLGFWDRFGLASDRRLGELIPHFHNKMEDLPPRLVPILEGDLNMNLIVKAERRLGSDEPLRPNAIKMLRDSLGMK